VIKKPKSRRPRPDLGCRDIGWREGILECWISNASTLIAGVWETIFYINVALRLFLPLPTIIVTYIYREAVAQVFFPEGGVDAYLRYVPQMI
jgi:hypothetical protein